MADLNLNLKHTVSPHVLQRTVLLGRVKMAQAIQMPESEWAKLLSDIEHDDLFQELLTARNDGQSLIRYKRFGHTGLSGQFYEMQDANVVGGNGVSPEALLDQKKVLLGLIQKVGQDRFEKYFLYREEGLSLETIATECGMKLEEAQQIQEFVISMSVQAEFYHPSSLNSNEKIRPTMIGKIVKNDDGTFSILYFSPHMARGMYEINHAALRRWQKEKHLDRTRAAKLRKYIGVLEMSNLKQGAFWRVIDLLLEIQREFLDSKDPTKMAPVSLRGVARKLQFAPSTISRVIGTKSVLLPWDREVPLSYLMPGQRKTVLNILGKVLTENAMSTTDAKLAQLIADRYGVKVSRRTITACRHIIQKESKDTIH